MRILLAEDELISRTMLASLLAKWDFDPVVTEDGAVAWGVMQKPEAPSLAILDWNMPRMDGLEVCRRIRQLPSSNPPYVIILTSRGEKDNIIQGLDAGANDYISKPYDPHELRARLGVGRRMVTMQNVLAERMRDLEEALHHIKTLQGILPICCYCNKIRDDKQYWHQVETYIAAHSEAQFSHGICPECYEKHVQPMLDKECDGACQFQTRKKVL